MSEEAKLISIGDLFRQSWSLYRERFTVLAGIFLAPVILVSAGAILTESGISKGIGDIMSLIGGIVYFMAELALIYQLRNQSGAGDSYRNAFRNIFPYIWLIILPSLIILGGFFMLIVPGIIFIVWLLFPLYIFVFEDQRGMNAVLRSREYVQGNWWRVFGRMVFFVAVLLVVYILPASLAPSSIIASNIVAGIVEFIFVPLSIVYIYLIYESIKKLKPEIASQPPAGPRGFFYFSAVLGISAIIGLILLSAFSAAMLSGFYFYQPGLDQSVPEE